jgi:hypothetical protein
MMQSVVEWNNAEIAFRQMAGEFGARQVQVIFGDLSCAQAARHGAMPFQHAQAANDESIGLCDEFHLSGTASATYSLISALVSR